MHYDLLLTYFQIGAQSYGDEGCEPALADCKMFFRRISEQNKILF